MTYVERWRVERAMLGIKSNVSLLDQNCSNYNVYDIDLYAVTFILHNTIHLPVTINPIILTSRDLVTSLVDVDVTPRRFNSLTRSPIGIQLNLLESGTDLTEAKTIVVAFHPKTKTLDRFGKPTSSSEFRAVFETMFLAEFLELNVYRRIDVRWWPSVYVGSRRYTLVAVDIRW